MQQVYPLLSYFLVGHLAKQGHLSFLPEQVVSVLPFLAAAVVWFIQSKLQAATQGKENAKLLGQAAPDFELKLKDKTTTLQKLVAETVLPTVVDFYQNF
jgi:hypothetical protein